MPVRPASEINTFFDLSTPDGEALWEGGTRMPTVPGHTFQFDRIRRSACGEWVVRKTAAPTALNPESACEIARAEYSELLATGHGFVSLGNAPAEKPPSPQVERRARTPRQYIITVLPWISGLVVCSKELFYASVDPKMGKYYAENRIARRPFYLHGDMRNHYQNSEYGKPGTAVLHDADSGLVETGY